MGWEAAHAGNGVEAPAFTQGVLHEERNRTSVGLFHLLAPKSFFAEGKHGPLEQGEQDTCSLSLKGY
jgi:hypothetical protein